LIHSFAVIASLKGRTRTLVFWPRSPAELFVLGLGYQLIERIYPCMPRNGLLPCLWLFTSEIVYSLKILIYALDQPLQRECHRTKEHLALLRWRASRCLRWSNSDVCLFCAGCSDDVASELRSIFTDNRQPAGAVRDSPPS